MRLLIDRKTTNNVLDVTCFIDDDVLRAVDIRIPATVNRFTAVYARRSKVGYRGHSIKRYSSIRLASQLF